MRPRVLATALAGALVFLSILAAGNGCSSSIAGGAPALFPDPPDNSITFWGHACVYIDVDGFGIVTDPAFQKTAHIRRRRVPAPPPSSYEHTGVILISHAHSDHLSIETIETFPESAVVLCPAPSADYLRDLGREVRVMKLGDEYRYPGGRIVAVAALHAGSRFGITNEADGRALGYVVYTPESVIYYSGDTNYFRGFEEVGEKHRPDIAILNINGHLHSEDAIQAALATRARTVIPIHFGAFGYLWGGVQEVPRNYEEIETVLEPVLLLLKPGESVPLSGRRSASGRGNSR
jgi:L-ascorbate metabolism protein UlaG (beta-lactamase superfamily)